MKARGCWSGLDGILKMQHSQRPFAARCIAFAKQLLDAKRTRRRFLERGHLILSQLNVRAAELIEQIRVIRMEFQSLLESGYFRARIAFDFLCGSQPKPYLFASGLLANGRLQQRNSLARLPGFAVIHAKKEIRAR